MCAPAMCVPAVGAPAALVPHAAKTMLRAASTTFTAGLANPVLSLAEDALVVFLFIVAVVLPFLIVTALAAAVVLLVVRWRRRPAPVTAS